MTETSLAYASLPGIGRILDPKPAHYRAAIRWLTNDICRNPYPPRRNPDARKLFDPRIDLRVDLWNTLRKIEWRHHPASDARAA